MPPQTAAGRRSFGGALFMQGSQLGLSVGMSLDDVRRLLVGWQDHPVRAADTLDQTHYFSLGISCRRKVRA